MAAGRPRVYLCDAGDCREDRAAWKALVDAVEPHADVKRVGCQKVCEGPTAGLEVDGVLEWFGELSTDKSRHALVDLVAGKGLGKPLLKRWRRKRSGKLRD